MEAASLHQFTRLTTKKFGEDMGKKKQPSKRSNQPASKKTRADLRSLHLKREVGHKYHVKGKKTKEQFLIDAMERARLAEYAMYFEKPWRLLGMNFLIGLARGLGTTIGLALVLALLVYIAQEIISANLPGISQWLADLLGLVQSYSVSKLPYNE